MTATAKRDTNPGFRGWDWQAIVEKVAAEAAWQAERDGEDVADEVWQSRIDRAARLLDLIVEGVCQAGVYPAFLLDHVSDLLPACLMAVDTKAPWEELDP